MKKVREQPFTIRLTLNVAPDAQRQLLPTEVLPPSLVTSLVTSCLLQPETVSIGELLRPVQADLRRVEEKMLSMRASLFAPLAEVFIDLIGSGGKRLRPALALLTASAYASRQQPLDHERVLALAAAVEMLHTASLVHDDVVDGALLRRGAPTLNAEWSPGSTVLAGNYLFGHAAGFAAETNNMRVIDIFSDTLNIIVNGELDQLSARFELEQKKSGYYQRIYAKTASLFSAATEGAAVLVDAGEEEVQRLKNYGYNFGMAFQIVDDVLDFTGNEDSLGKPAGGDLRQGMLTLPFFYYLEQHPRPDALLDEMRTKRAQAESGNPAPWNALVDGLVLDVRRSDAIESAQQEAFDFLKRAQENVAPLPDSACKKSLIGLCMFVVQRTY